MSLKFEKMLLYTLYKQFLWCGPQDDGNQCTAVSGSPECVCGNGYTYNEERNICEDVDECTALGEVQSDELSRKRR